MWDWLTDNNDNSSDYDPYAWTDAEASTELETSWFDTALDFVDEANSTVSRARDSTSTLARTFNGYNAGTGAGATNPASPTNTATTTTSNNINHQAILGNTVGFDSRTNAPMNGVNAKKDDKNMYIIIGAVVFVVLGLVVLKR